MLFVLVLPIFYYSIKHLGIFVPILVYLGWLVSWRFSIFGMQDIFFFVLGCYFGIHDKFFPDFKKSTSIILLITWIIGTLIVTQLVLMDPDSIIFQGLKKTLRIFGVVTIWSLFTYIPEKVGALLANGTVYTFFIFALHEPLMTLVLAVTSRLLPYSDAYHLILYFSNFILAATISLVIALIAEKYLNPVFKVLSGGR